MEGRLELFARKGRPLDIVTIRLVNGDRVGQLQDPFLYSLKFVSRPGTPVTPRRIAFPA